VAVATRRDKLDPPSPSPEAREDITVTILEDAVPDAKVGSDSEEEKAKRLMEELNRLSPRTNSFCSSDQINPKKSTF
jgi:hypothetical protein